MEKQKVMHRKLDMISADSYFITSKRFIVSSNLTAPPIE